ncbi:F-box protein CPR1-like [Solanum stenotomum]|uniref:F-box protein CPR1-like n=1 Tax=Solanum stenotomum TaxID=172797 RepID=UPI0020D04BA3|nr:F-box protein CPR1-like [Solanum stenotomum]
MPKRFMNFPNDVSNFILLMLPVKSLLRFKCVSRAFNTILESSTFVNIHLNRTITIKDELILLKRSFKEDCEQYKTIFSFLSGEIDDYLNPVFPDLDVPYMTDTNSIVFDQLVGPCNGLIALMDSLTVVIFNPSTRHFRFLPPSPFRSPKGVHRYVKCVGFGFDSVVNDYKVVRICELLKDDCYGYIQVEKENVEIYELGIDCWRELDWVDQQFPILNWLPCSQIFYNGTCHWIAHTVILCFDVSGELFRTMEMPNTRHNYVNGPNYSLVIQNESLTFICYPSVLPANDPLEDLTEIWIMKYYNVHDSWIKKYTIRGLSIEIPLALWKTHLFLFQRKNGCLMFYDLNSEEVKGLNIHGCPNSMRVAVYKENLTAIPRGNKTTSTQLQKF